jgi:hypothetical protein
MLMLFLVIIAGILAVLWIWNYPRKFLRILGVGFAVVVAVIAFNAGFPGLLGGLGFLVPIIIVAVIVYALATSRRRS